MKKTCWIMLIFAVVGSASAQLSVTPSLPPGGWTHGMWLPRFDAKKALAAEGGYDVVFIGDSITHFWESYGSKVWEQNFANAPYRALNCGISGDCTEHVLWRLRNGQLADLDPKAFVIMIGTNNTGHRSADVEAPVDTILGVQAILDYLTENYRSAKIILHPIFPRGATIHDRMRMRNDAVNDVIRTFADGKRILWCDFNGRLLSPEGVLEKTMAKDLLHPGTPGYVIWAEELKAYLDYALGKTKVAPKASATPARDALPRSGAAATVPQINRRWLNGGSEKTPSRIRRKRAERYADSERYYDAVMIGGTLTHFWEKKGNAEVLKKKLASYKIYNAGFAGDRTQNTIWNISNGGVLDGVHTRLVTLMIGSDNIGSDTPEDVAAGINACIKGIRAKQPQAKILLMPLLPAEAACNKGNRGSSRKDVKTVIAELNKVNHLIRPFADGKNVIWFDLAGCDGVASDGSLPEGVRFYGIWADALLGYLGKYCRK